ncbi:DUF805 domain-containing protein [Tabrizicola sp. BL-A-41-H6]|uniref:DUF805 domain-containing protein n=1 Tax=Tabrizicola sp. BL-A-41-H6 TaxID=3421107 RepID=UPI003D673C36
MGIGQAIMSGYRNCADFSGRTGVDEYWHFARFTQVATFGLGLCIAYVTVRSQSQWMQSMASLSEGGTVALEKPSLARIALIGTLAVLAVSVPLWSCAVRRLHDTGRSAWHYVGPPLVALSLLALAYAAFVPPGVSPVQALAVLFTPIWLYEPRLLLGFVAFAVLTIWMRSSLHRKLREPSQPGPNPYGPPPSEVPQ